MNAGSTLHWHKHHFTAGWLCALLVLSGLGCEPNASGGGDEATPAPKDAPVTALMDFPEALHADDSEINAFIKRLVQTCIDTDYEAFRLMWSALEEPLGEQEFLVGFRATRHVTVLDLTARRTREGEIVYLLYCLVELDPDVVPDPKRDIVLLLRKESGDWRIARPPRREAKALKSAFAEKHGIQRDKAKDESKKDADRIEISRDSDS